MDIQMTQGSGSIMDAMHVAIGLGGWKVDPADPWKAPYSPADATLAAAAFVGVDLTDEDRELLERAVERSRDADERNPEDYR